MKLAALAILVTLALTGCGLNATPEFINQNNWNCLTLYSGGQIVEQHSELRNVYRHAATGRIGWDNHQGQRHHYVGSYLITEEPCQS